MNATRSPKNGLPVVLGVVAAGEVGVERAQLERDDREALALEPADDLADEPALDGIGLAEDEGAGRSWARQASRTAHGRPSVHEHRPGGTDDVERAGDDDLAVGGR